MFGTRKRKILVWSVIISSIALSACNENQGANQQAEVEGIEISGNTQGTTYTIILAEDNSVFSQEQVEFLFSNFDGILSTYIDSSVISQMNRCEDSITVHDSAGYLERCYNVSRHVYYLSNGAFDPSVYPLVSGWGFMSNMETPLDQEEVDSILTFVSFEKEKLHSIDFHPQYIKFKKVHKNFMLDFNAVAQGLSVDIIDEYLASIGCENYYIEIGGEIIVRGKNREGNDWRIGIDVPKENLSVRELENIVHLSDRAIATSGNYRKFYIHDGVKYAHTLDPRTGFPVQHSLLSATVVANDCATADAYATTFMVFGVEKSLAYVTNHPNENLEVYLLFTDDNGNLQRAMSLGFTSYLKE
ncbi:MAG: FAD:protein FMN transferase [Crocinitomicaceae bacterium]|nr:FAD:protein FMN transferase [Crocinitomicaceae bacterium]